MKLLIPEDTWKCGFKSRHANMTNETIVLLDENLPSWYAYLLEKHFGKPGLVITSVEEMGLRRAPDDDIIARIDEHRTWIITADKNLSRRVTKSIFVKHPHSIKKPTPMKMKKAMRSKLFREIIEQMFEKGLINITKDGEDI